ncbi:MAG: hypothetical protein A2Z20_10775 [Bdellovibrionales bacterium RBG_16_40_8]|nr:MAG: hypothetical protein A2Z20_10775 [Bdellovibrionales bacterium RBG_16_40_8]
MSKFAYKLITFLFLLFISHTGHCEESPIVVENTVESENVVKSDSYLEKIQINLNRNAGRIEDAISHQGAYFKNFWERLDQLPLSLPIQENLKLFRGMSINLGYKYHVEPSYTGGYFTHIDTYKVRIPINVGDWILPDGVPFISLNPGAEINFWQYFKTATEARNPLNGYSLAHFPLTAERAINNLKPGDLVHLRTNTNINIGVRKSWNIPLGLEVSGNIAYILQGEFDTFIFRSDENKIRLRIIGRRDKGVNGSVAMGVQSSFKIFAVNIVDNKIIKITHLDEILAYDGFENDQNIYIVDYTLNLDSPEVREAYNELFATNLRLKNFNPAKNAVINLINPFKSHGEITDTLISNLSKLNDLFHEDLFERDHSKRRVDRNIMGSNNAENVKQRNFRFGINGLYRLNTLTIRRDNRLTLFTTQPDGSETRDNYFYPSWIKGLDQRGLFGLFRDNTLRSTDMIYITNDDFVPIDFKSIGFYFDYSDKNYKNREHKKNLEHFQRILTPALYQKLIDYLISQDLFTLNGTLKNARVYSRYYINVRGLRSIESILKELRRDGAENYIRKITIGLIDNTPNAAIAHTTHQKQPHRPRCHGYKSYSKRVIDNCKKIEDIVKRLALALDTEVPLLERHTQMEHLLNNSLFNKIGPGIIFRLIPENELATSSFFEIKFYLANKIEPYVYLFPPNNNYEDREFYKIILDIQKIMDDMTPEMREPLI